MKFSERSGRLPCRVVHEQGPDATSTSLASAFFHLAQNAEVYGKLCLQVRSTFTSVNEIVPWPRLNSCVYLRAWDSHGHHIPASVDAVIYSIYHQADYYPQPY
ncbi:hypothetical protein HBH74_205570 [Parastagonospora nodorum]|nr:hypothetical protein HBI05_225130 [Parastagonospora nodorum]KAH4892794.1 hypothetical protein HBH74_205570 [Parastagonospora nodorum]